MFQFENPSDLDDHWYLGDNKRHAGRIPKHLMKDVSNMHMIGIQFLYENYILKRGGAILNQEENMNMCLQVCLFLSSIKEEISKQSPILIICPDYLLSKWHFHITEAGFKSEILSTENIILCEVCLLTSESLKSLKELLEWKLFCIVIDELDSLVTKSTILRLKGNFRIGLTKRNFYINPDPKLKWRMLNWTSPSCVGKLLDFLSIDQLHSLAFADNYRFWWLRLTWKFCDSFEQPTEDELKDYEQKLKEWGSEHNIGVLKTSFAKTKRKHHKSDESVRIKRKPKGVQNIESSENIPNTSTSIRNTMDTSESMYDNKQISGLRIIRNGASVEELSGEEHQELNENEEFDGMNLVDAEEISKYNKPSKDNNSYETDDENPILSIISSQQPFRESDTVDNLLMDIQKLSQSSGSDDFLSVLVKNRNAPSRAHTSQQISHVLENLSDVEDTIERSSGDEDFFSELIVGSSNKTKN